MRCTRFQTRAFVALLVVLMLPAATVHAQATPEGSPEPGGPCISSNDDPTETFNIEFERLAGPPDNREEGPSLYRVYFIDSPAIFLTGCEGEPLAVSVSSGTVYLEAFNEGTTSVFFENGIPGELESHCTVIEEPSEHETRAGCVLAPDGAIATLNVGDGAFHEQEGTFAYAGSEEDLGQLRESGLTYAKMAGAGPGRGNATGRHQPSDKSIDVASPKRKPTGCGAECH